MTITVSQLNNYIHGLFDIDGVLNDVTVCGEVTNVKQSRDGWYFSLKDENGAINCFCYASAGVPVVGITTVVEGRVNYFVKNGSISLFARRITATQNTGSAYEKFVMLKNKLLQEGLFDEERKKVVPTCCNKIGVVTSQTGAVIHDITNVVLRRQPFSQILLYPVKVQGEGADFEIAQGVLYFSQSDVDVVIVGRGGGSNEDLSAFNSEIVVRAIAECQKPVVSAVGHGVDFTLCDFVADKRAVTPTEAGEFVTVDSVATKRKICLLLNKAYANVCSQIYAKTDKIAYDQQKINSVVSLSVKDKLNQARSAINNICNIVDKRFCACSANLQSTTNKLSSLNPASILQRGFSYVTASDKNVKSIEQLDVGQQIRITFFDGKATATITDREKK